jgi:two-component system, chemotaxis family, response regulator Rcp1
MPDLAATHPVEILLVEDNPADVVLTRDALAASKIANTVHIVEDGVEAMAFLRRQGAYADRPRPDIVLLDLNLPRKNGLEVLAEMKADEELKVIPVVILTVSSDEDDILGAYGLHANCYITKPVGLRQFEEIVRRIEDFWFAIVTLPPQPAKP